MRTSAAAVALIVVVALAAAAPAGHAATPTPSRTTKAAQAKVPRLVAFRGHTGYVWRHSGDMKKLESTSKAFRAFVRHKLDRMWKLNGSRPECEHSPVLLVERWRSDGYAEGWKLWRAHDGDPASCTVSEGDDALFKRTKNGWKEVAVSAGGDFECSSIRKYAIPANVAGPVCQRDDSTDHAYGPKVALNLKLGSCQHCRVELVQASTGWGLYWRSKPHKLSGGTASFTVRESRTVGMSFEIYAPWATAGNATPNIVTHYKGHALGVEVAPGQAARAKKATACWAGASARKVTIPITVQSFRATDVAGNPAKGIRAYVTRGLNDGAAKWERTYRGSLGNQDAYYC